MSGRSIRPLLALSSAAKTNIRAQPPSGRRPAVTKPQRSRTGASTSVAPLNRHRFGHSATTFDRHAIRKGIR